MNDRIRALMEQASCSACYDEPNQISLMNNEIELFAELIVAECIDIASQEDFDVMMKEGYPCSQTAKKIKQHFGVEE